MLKCSMNAKIKNILLLCFVSIGCGLDRLIKQDALAVARISSEVKFNAELYKDKDALLDKLVKMIIAEAVAYSPDELLSEGMPGVPINKRTFMDLIGDVLSSGEIFLATHNGQEYFISNISNPTIVTQKNDVNWFVELDKVIYKVDIPAKALIFKCRIKIQPNFFVIFDHAALGHRSNDFAFFSMFEPFELEGCDLLSLDYLHNTSIISCIFLASSIECLRDVLYDIVSPEGLLDRAFWFSIIENLEARALSLLGEDGRDKFLANLHTTMQQRKPGRDNARQIRWAKIEREIIERRNEEVKRIEAERRQRIKSRSRVNQLNGDWIFVKMFNASISFMFVKILIIVSFGKVFPISIAFGLLYCCLAMSLCMAIYSANKYYEEQESYKWLKIFSIMCSIILEGALCDYTQYFNRNFYIFCQSLILCMAILILCKFLQLTIKVYVEHNKDIQDAKKHIEARRHKEFNESISKLFNLDSIVIPELLNEYILITSLILTIIGILIYFTNIYLILQNYYLLFLFCKCVIGLAFLILLGEIVIRCLSFITSCPCPIISGKLYMWLVSTEFLMLLYIFYFPTTVLSIFFAIYAFILCLYFFNLCFVEIKYRDLYPIGNI